jgi:hypothetical protein
MPALQADLPTGILRQSTSFYRAEVRWNGAGYGSAVKQPPHDHIAAGEFSTCAHYNKRIDAGDVEQFLGLLRDVNVDVGVMISPEGYMILPRPPHECAMTGR